MGRRGPAPRPTALKLMRGERADRLNAFEPTPSAKPPRCPRSLSPEARLVWRRLAPDIQRAGVLTAWDVDMFACFCNLVVIVDRARLLLEAGLIVARRGPGPPTAQPEPDLTARRGQGVTTNPAWRIYRDGIEQLRSLAQEFGLTPSARSRIRVRPRLEVMEMSSTGSTED
jgi:P27 family predicted phage terminase small subunit